MSRYPDAIGWDMSHPSSTRPSLHRRSAPVNCETHDLAPRTPRPAASTSGSARRQPRSTAGDTQRWPAPSQSVPRAGSVSDPVTVDRRGDVSVRKKRVTRADRLIRAAMCLAAGHARSAPITRSGSASSPAVDRAIAGFDGSPDGVPLWNSSTGRVIRDLQALALRTAAFPQRATRSGRCSAAGQHPDSLGWQADPGHQSAIGAVGGCSAWRQSRSADASLYEAPEDLSGVNRL